MLTNALIQNYFDCFTVPGRTYGFASLTINFWRFVVAQEWGYLFDKTTKEDLSFGRGEPDILCTSNAPIASDGGIAEESALWKMEIANGTPVAKSSS